MNFLVLINSLAPDLWYPDTVSQRKGPVLFDDWLQNLRQKMYQTGLEILVIPWWKATSHYWSHIQKSHVADLSECLPAKDATVESQKEWGSLWTETLPLHSNLGLYDNTKYRIRHTSYLWRMLQKSSCYFDKRQIKEFSVYFALQIEN